MGETNKSEEEHHVWTAEQIHVLLSTVADLRQRVVSLENGSKQSVSHGLLSVFFKNEAFVASCSRLRVKNKHPSLSQSKDDDAAIQPATTSETPATETVQEATTTKATPGDVQGTVLYEAGCHWICPCCKCIFSYHIRSYSQRRPRH